MTEVINNKENKELLPYPFCGCTEIRPLVENDPFV